MIKACMHLFFWIQDEDRGVQLTVLTDTSQGGSSLNDGQMELMVCPLKASVHHRYYLHESLVESYMYIRFCVHFTQAS